MSQSHNSLSGRGERWQNVMIPFFAARERFDQHMQGIGPRDTTTTRYLALLSLRETIHDIGYDMRQQSMVRGVMLEAEDVTEAPVPIDDAKIISITGMVGEVVEVLASGDAPSPE